MTAIYLTETVNYIFWHFEFFEIYKLEFSFGLFARLDLAYFILFSIFFIFISRKGLILNLMFGLLTMIHVDFGLVFGVPKI